MSECRLLPYAAADGPRNMAADETLLHSAAAGVASLRFYGWSAATLSIGYFQVERSCRQPPLDSLPYVRRPSGGTALVHHHEITYALALPAGSPWQSREPWLRRMHQIIAAALQQLGVAVQAQDSERRSDLANVLCFRHHATGDLLIGSDKIVGSAQRWHRGALLQHGAILLAASSATPELPGILELSGRALGMDDVAQTVQREFARQTGWALHRGHWTPEENQHIDELIAAKYTQTTWNHKR